MKENNLIQVKTYAFSLRIIKVYKQLQTDQREFILSKQLIRSATSVDANVEEAIGGQSKRDFISKLKLPTKKPEIPATGFGCLLILNILQWSWVQTFNSKLKKLSEF